MRAVVRIRTVRQQGDGLSLDLTLSDEHDLRYDFDRPQAKVGANYRKNGVDVFGERIPAARTWSGARCRMILY